MSVKESPVRGRFFYGWWIVFAAAAINLLTGATFFYGFGVFFTPILNEFGWTNTQVALAMSLIPRKRKGDLPWLTHHHGKANGTACLWCES